MGFTKRGTGTILNEGRKTASSNDPDWSVEDEQELAEENEQADDVEENER